MCQITLSKRTEKDFFTVVTSVTVVTVVRTIRQHLHKKILQPLISFYFLITFGKSNLIHLTTDVMFSGQGFAILAMFKQEVGIG